LLCLSPFPLSPSNDAAIQIQGILPPPRTAPIFLLQRRGIAVVVDHPLGWIGAEIQPELR
jgi:hypothetical protein